MTRRDQRRTDRKTIIPIVREVLVVVAELQEIVLSGAFVACAIALMIRGDMPEAALAAWCARRYPSRLSLSTR
jgi:hypothetical protein